MRRTRASNPESGISLVELMIAVAVLSTVSLATALAYNKAMQALVLSKSRGIAARLAQDKFETLSGLSYPLLMVTSQTDLDINPPAVDQTNYPPETINMAGKTFTRMTIVSRVYRDSAGNIVVLSPNSADTGLKQLKVLLQYQQGSAVETKTYALLVSDPKVTPLNATVYGVVLDTGGAAISGAKVFVTQNQNWTALASSTGYYQIPMDTQTYTLTATKAGYWDRTSASVTPLGATQLNWQLQPKLTGAVAGLVTARPPSLRISGVFAGSALAPNSHFLELYNPTTAPFLVTDGLAAKIRIKRVPSDNSVNNVTFSWGDLNPHSVPAQGYYLIATASPTINGVAPDALFTAPTNPFSDLTQAGVAVQDAFGVGMDTVGWTNATGNPGPSNGVETSGAYTGGSNWGANGILLRLSKPPSSVTLGMGNSYDSNRNAVDIVLQASVPAGYPRNSTSGASPASYGVPAAGAAALATDGYSAATTASSTGYYLLNAVTTGTWSVAGFWTSYSSRTPSSVAVNTGATTSLDLLLEPTAAGQGGVAGRVVRSDTLAALPGITVSAGTSQTLTDAAGNYVLSLTSGSYTILANDGFGNISYNMLTTTAAVPAGAMTTGVNFNLVPSGVVAGRVTTNGVDAYPNFPVHAVYQGLEAATAVTDSLGNYSLYGVPTGAETVEPVLDPLSQTAAPASVALSVVQGNTHTGNDFAINSSLGKISGTVTQGSTPISNGVLIVASTTSLAALPLVDSSFRNGSTVLYSSISDTSGRYSLTVVRNSTYTVYAYFPSLVGSNATATAQLTAASVFVSSSTQRNFQW